MGGYRETPVPSPWPEQEQGISLRNTLSPCCCRTSIVRWNYVAKNFAQVRSGEAVTHGGGGWGGGGTEGAGWGRPSRRSEGGAEGRSGYWARVQTGEGQQPSVPPSIQATAAPLSVQALGCIFYACFILGRLCVPVFTNMSQEPFSTRALVLSIMHATLPGPCGQGWLGRVVFEDPLFPLHPYSVSPPPPCTCPS